MPSPRHELEVDPQSRPYVLVFLKNNLAQMAFHKYEKGGVSLLVADPPLANSTTVTDTLLGGYGVASGSVNLKCG